jgi:hypothetical protein
MYILKAEIFSVINETTEFMVYMVSVLQDVVIVYFYQSHRIPHFAEVFVGIRSSALMA